MSEQEPQQEIFGEYHPEAAGHPAYNDAMAAWRSEVRSMQQQGTLPAPEATEPPEVESVPETVEDQAAPSEPHSGSGGGSEVELQGIDGDAYPEPSQASSGLQLFDPSEHTAPEVLRHLENAGEDEAERVLKAEEEGKGRKGILNHREEILKRSRERDELRKTNQNQPGGE